MRSRSLVKFLAVPVAVAGLAAVAAMTAPAAHADAINVDQGGTVTLTLPMSYVEHLANAGIVGSVPAKELSTSGPDKTVSVTLNVTGGDGDTSVFFGTVDLSGSVQVSDSSGCHVVKLKGLQLDVADSEIIATPAGAKSPVVLLDTSALTVTSTPSATPAGTFADTYEADTVAIDPDGATYLNKALHTKAFKAGKAVGTVNGSWSVVYPQS